MNYVQHSSHVIMQLHYHNRELKQGKCETCELNKKLIHMADLCKKRKYAGFAGMEVIMKQLKKLFILTLCILFLSQSTAFAANYKVATGDSLYKIGKLFKVSVSSLKKTNKLKSDSIRAGQVLKVSALEYKVKSGDTLTKIAKKYGVTVAAVKKANNKKTSSIKAGQKLVIPGVKPKSTTVTKTTTAKTTAAKSAATSTKYVVPCTSEELTLLSKLIEAEAGGEAYQAKVAVAGVVINRVQSKDWASTIKGVIYEKSGGYYQFTPVKNGYINKVTVSAASKKAAKEALAGKDPSKGAMFYFDTSSTNQWLWSKTKTAAIDHMVFVK